jgi:hypothetical protein
VKSGDKPAAAHFVLLIKLELLLPVIENDKNKVKPSGTREICGLDFDENIFSVEPVHGQIGNKDKTQGKGQ